MRPTLAILATLACLGAFAAEAPTSFGSASISARWQVKEGHLVGMTVSDHTNGRELSVIAPFKITLKDGRSLGPSDFRLDSPARIVGLQQDPRASRLVERLPGSALEATFTDADGRFRLEWRLVQRLGSDYLREIVTVTALKGDEPITRVELFQVKADAPEVIGTVPGSPIVSGPDYLGFEHPLSNSEARGSQARVWIERDLPLLKGRSVTYSAVIGVTHPGQLRRDFATYVERERAHPYRPFLHYNSWYDIGYFTPYTEAQALDRIHAFGEELTVKRGVKLDSFLFDDGWDDRSGSWRFSQDFPHGFGPLRDAAAKYGAAPGLWLSPWGGYGPPAKERATRGAASGYELMDGRLALSGPKYYARFHEVVLDLVKADGINQFKFDGTGNADKVIPGSAFDSDFAAAIQLIEDLRAAKPGLFINLTTGTLASPFWLRYADSIWRDGEDDSETGVGTTRERWITYRDQQTYQNIVQKGPLFPLNSLMLHGLIYAKENRQLHDDPGHDFANEIHSYFATGTQLQELYLTPSLLSNEDWDTLADAAKWSRANAGVLRDTHWIGGDPGRLDVYGWAAWTPNKAILTLRNPDAKPQLAILDLPRQLELPPNAARTFTVHDRWATGGAKVPKHLEADHPTVLQLAPFEVLTLELSPAR